ncbi:MAG: sulfite exporter TauE/SafE family protein [Gemmatimonadales bacterium]
MSLLFLAVGLAAGVLSGLFGIGGGVVIVAALVSVGKMPIHIAVGTSLAALLLPVGLLGVREYWKAGHIDLRAAGLIALGIAIGVYFGARFAQGLTPVTLQRAFAVFLGLMALRTWIKVA